MKTPGAQTLAELEQVFYATARMNYVHIYIYRERVYTHIYIYTYYIYIYIDDLCFFIGRYRSVQVNEERWLIQTMKVLRNHAKLSSENWIDAAIKSIKGSSRIDREEPVHAQEFTQKTSELTC